jgi:hypothetical protein
MKIPLICEFVVNSLNGVIRLYYCGNLSTQSWYSFLGEPVIDFDLNVTLGENTLIDINLFTVR